jgi:RhtB (resistance to homoserine/threonine) family protein
MSYWGELLTIAGIHLLAVASPGPDFAIVLRQSLRFGSKTGRETAIGVGTGILIHATYSVLGFGLLISKYEWLYNGMRFLAAGYLLFLAYQGFRAKRVEYEAVQSEKREISFKKAFSKGFLVNAFNPKVTLFFLSIYTAVVSESTPFSWQVVYGIYMAVATMIWFSLVATLFGQSRIRNWYNRYNNVIEKIIALALTLLAIKLIWG